MLSVLSCEAESSKHVDGYKVRLKYTLSDGRVEKLEPLIVSDLLDIPSVITRSEAVVLSIPVKEH